MFSVACLLMREVAASALPDHKVPNVFHPFAVPARSEFSIGMLVFAITGTIFLVVAGLLVYTLVRFRARANEKSGQEPPQVYGSNRIEAAWTVIPILIVFVLAGVTARVIWGVEDASPPKETLHVEVIGHQYWWEVRYPYYHVVTANEIHVPVAQAGQNVTYIELKSADLIHSLWVPELGGKTDLIPGRVNHMWIDPREPGIYRGACTEFCGVQHANMLVEVVAQKPEDFQNWITARQEPQTCCSASYTRTGAISRVCLLCLPRNQRHSICGDVRSRSHTSHEPADHRGWCSAKPARRAASVGFQCAGCEARLPHAFSEIGRQESRRAYSLSGDA